MKAGTGKRALWTLAICGILISVAAVGWNSIRKSEIRRRVYRIGWENDPPFQMEDSSGNPTGLAIDLVREAAIKKGLQLEWVKCSKSSEPSLGNKAVDLWPLVTITPERLKKFHITEGYLDINRCLVVQAGSPYQQPEDLSGAIVSIFDLPVNNLGANLALRTVRLVPRQSCEEAITDVCRGKSQAAFMEEYTAITALMSGVGCANQKIRLIPISGPKPQLGIGATFESQEAADLLREAIGVMASEGRLSEILARWSYMSSHNLELVTALLEARRTERWLTVILSIFASLFVLTLWQAIRVRSERNRAADAEAALRETEERFRTIVELAPDGIYFIGRESKFIEVNRTVCSQLGYTREEMLQKRIVDILPKDRVEGVYDRLRQSSAAGVSYESRLVKSDGSELPVELKIREVSFAGQQAYVGIARDISERKRSEQALRESESRFRELLETLQLAAVTTDRLGNFTFCNDFLLSQTGWRRDEIMGRPIGEFVAPENKSACAEWMKSAFERKRTHSFSEFAFLTSDGKRRWVEWNSTLLRDGEGRSVGLAILGVDVTDHRNLREQYLQSQKLESIGRLAGGVAHDFNNILTVINGFAELIYGQMDASNPLRHDMEQILLAGTRAAELTQQLLAFSRKQVVQPRTLNLNSVISGSEKMFRRLVGEDVELSTALSPDAGLVTVDPGQVNQVLMNLLVNSRDAMPVGGKLTIETSNVEVNNRQAAEHPEMLPGFYVLLTVRDNGKGMDEATKSRIFEPFFTTKQMGVGTGLGLATVYGIIRQSKGHILVDSELGQGTIFRIYFPRADQSAENAKDAEPVPEELRGTETVLVVEDQKEVRRLARSVLKNLGYNVLEAADGLEALSVADQYQDRIHLLLSDIVMPGMSGKELAARMMKCRPDTAVLLTSGYSNDFALHRVVSDQEIAYLPKPYSSRGLAKKVRQIIDGRAS